MKNRGDGERSGIGFRVLTADRRSVAIFFPRLYPSFYAVPRPSFSKVEQMGCARRQGTLLWLFEFAERVRFCLFLAARVGDRVCVYMC